MRNTRDWYLFADRLNCVGKRLYFYLENTFYSPEDALLTGIKAILAEEYSRELSKKMNLAHQKRQQNNGKPVLTSKSYGYRRTADGAIEIIPEEAAVKRRMYELCADGLGGRKIAAVLAAEGVRSRAAIGAVTGKGDGCAAIGDHASKGKALARTLQAPLLN